MKWFVGDIATAIGQAKSRGAIFVVYCEGKDDTSKQITELINSDEISQKLESDSFVAIKVESDKEEYMQFAKIYQLVPVPSMFFIKNGIPIKIVTGTVKTVAELEEAISAVLKSDSATSSQQQQISTAVSSSPVTKTTPEALITDCEDDDGTKESEGKTSQPSSPSKNETEEEKQEKIKKALKLIEQKRIEKVQEERRLDKEREVQRRKEGQAVQDLKKWQEDQELKQIKEDRLRDKNEAKAARQRVLDQIAEDKKDRATRFPQSTPTEQKTSPVAPPTPTTPSSANTARIQFKKPDGETEVVTFDSEMLFADLHLFVKNDVLQGLIREFYLATTFPRKEYTDLDFKKTLAELGLTPSAVLLIIPGKKVVSQGPSGQSSVLPTQGGGLFEMLTSVLMGMFTPMMALIGYIRGLIFRAPEAGGESANDAGKRKRNEDILLPNDAAKKRNLNAFNNPVPGTSGQASSPTGTIPKTGAYKRQNPSNNIHRLHQDSDTDDEEKKTYNGNSTQQM